MEKKKITKKTAIEITANISDYNLLKTIGMGSFGRVRLGSNVHTKKNSAIKIIKKHEIMKMKQVDHVVSEIRILSSVKHPFIVKLEGIAQDNKYIYMIQELVTGGELFNFLREENKFTFERTQFYAGNIVTILEFLHSKNIVYRDLKPENLLFSTNGYLKLIDFGFAKVVDSKTYTLCGTPEYLAPEMLLNQGHTKPVDWWALGVLIYEMLVGISPFEDEDPMQVFSKILRSKLSFPTNFNNTAKSIIKRFLQKDLSKRLGNLQKGVQDVKEHKFFDNFMWEECLSEKLRPPILPKMWHDKEHNDEYPDSNSILTQVNPLEDPFANWEIKDLNN